MGANDITFDLPGGRFTYRVAGIAIHDGQALLHRAVSDDFWSLPGGRCMAREPSTAALTREMREELGVNVQVERLLWVAENFFTLDGVICHEVGLYYRMELPDDAPQLDPYQSFSGQEGALELIFRWFPLSELGKIRLYPMFLRAGLQAIPDAIQHIIIPAEDNTDDVVFSG